MGKEKSRFIRQMTALSVISEIADSKYLVFVYHPPGKNLLVNVASFP